MQAKEEIAKKITQAFLQELGVKVPAEKVVEYLEKLKKLGITNEYTEIFEVEGKKYLIRINGKLWPPYKRETEAYALENLNKNQIKTNVLVNGDGFQICIAPEIEQSLAAYLKKNDETEINTALILIASVIVKYQRLKAPDIEYPISDMLNFALKALDSKLAKNQETLETLRLFGETCIKIIALINRNKMNSCHNDLDSSSVFIDLTHSNVTIVDWEYAASAHWANDLAMLGRFLTPAQFNHLANAYHLASGLNGTMPDFEKNCLNFNRFILKFLYEIAWKIRDENVQDFTQIIGDMKLEMDGFIGILNQYLESPKLESSAENKNEDYPVILEQEKKKPAEYTPIFQPIVDSKRVWMPRPERDFINALLDLSFSGIIKKLNITPYKPHEKYRDKVSEIGWQLFIESSGDKTLCLAVLKVHNLKQANKLVDLFNNGGEELKARTGRCENKNCVIISWPQGDNKITTFDIISKELDKVIERNQHKSHHPK